MLKIILFFFISISSANAITLTQTVTADILFDLTSVAPTDAGDYFNDSYRRDTTLLTIDHIPNGKKWRVYAKLSNFVHSGQQKIEIRIKRMGKGTGVHTPVEGTSLITLDTNYQEIFNGKGKRFNIPMRTQIKGIGVYDDYGIFNSTIQFKVETY